MNRMLAPALLVFATFGRTTAQEVDPPEPGDRLRVAAAAVAAEPLVGTLVETAGRRLVLFLDQGDGVTTIPLESVERVEVFRGRRSRWGPALGAGAVAGLGIGVLTGLALDDRRSSEVSAGGWALLGGATGIALGLGTAAVVGATRGGFLPGVLVGAGGAVLLLGGIVDFDDPVPDVEGRLITSRWVLAVPGALIGGVTGAFNRPDRWEEVPLEQVRLLLGPRSGGLGFGATLAF
jgi:hypothetical protein